VLAVGESAAPSESGQLEQTGRVNFFHINQPGLMSVKFSPTMLLSCQLFIFQLMGRRR
jgi:hypothetical protein